MALLMGLMALRPGVALAEHDGTCHAGFSASAEHELYMTAIRHIVAVAVDMHLVVGVDPNGDEQAQGVLGPGGSRSDGPVAEPEGTQVSCADIDVDGVAGLA